MKTTRCSLLILVAPFVVGCEGVKQAPAPTEETAIISCEAARVTIETSSSGRKEDEFNEIVSHSLFPSSSSSGKERTKNVPDGCYKTERETKFPSR